jgi:hypothetical protein
MVDSLDAAVVEHALAVPADEYATSLSVMAPADRALWLPLVPGQSRWRWRLAARNAAVIELGVLLYAKIATKDLAGGLASELARYVHGGNWLRDRNAFERSGGEPVDRARRLKFRVLRWSDGRGERRALSEDQVARILEGLAGIPRVEECASRRRIMGAMAE